MEIHMDMVKYFPNGEYKIYEKGYWMDGKRNGLFTNYNLTIKTFKKNYVNKGVPEEFLFIILL